MSWKAGQIRSISDTTPSPAARESDFATDLISEAASLSRLIASLGPRQPYALARSLFLNSHFRLAAITSILVDHKNTKQRQESLASYHRLALGIKSAIQPIRPRLQEYWFTSCRILELQQQMSKSS